MTQAYARNSDPDTSHEAAASLDPTELELLCVYLLRASKDGLTAAEIAECADKDKWSISPRLAPLQKKGLVRDSGRRRVSPDTGRRQIIWEAV